MKERCRRCKGGVSKSKKEIQDTVVDAIKKKVIQKRRKERNGKIRFKIQRKVKIVKKQAQEIDLKAIKK